MSHIKCKHASVRVRRILHKLYRTLGQLLQSFGLHEGRHLVAAIDLCGHIW